jgi:hypothetical protein
MLLAKQAIRSKFDSFSGCAVKHQNEAFEANPLVPFLNYFIDGSTSYQSRMGSSQHYIDSCILFITAYIQSGIGDYDVTNILEQAANMFSCKKIVTSSPSTVLVFDRHGFSGNGNADDDGVWYMESLSIPFDVISITTGV